MNVLIKKVLFPIIVLTAIFILILNCVTDHTSKDTDTNYILKSYKNTVALYSGDEIVKIYNNIVLNTLPEQDIQNFNKGVPIATPTQAEAYLEDFDG